MAADKQPFKVLANNRKAYFNFEIEDKIECGIELKGTEVKSIRAGKMSFSDSYVRVINGELFLIGFNISPYKHGNIYNHEPDRTRKLLAHAQEIKRLQRRIDEQGFTLVPLRVYLKGGMVKMELGLGRGKKLHDKRHAIKEKDQKRDADREMSNRLRH
ncbi:MAG: SsrA-binding protein SmpB [Spirochaetaceae bacterium]